MSRFGKDLTKSSEVVIVDRELAWMLGMNMASVLSKVSNWAEYNRQTDDTKQGAHKMVRDGHAWMWMSMPKLADSTILGERTCATTVSSLEELGLLIKTTEYAMKFFDQHVNWYAVNYEKVEAMYAIWEEHGKPKRRSGGSQSDEYKDFMEAYKTVAGEPAAYTFSVDDEGENESDEDTTLQPLHGAPTLGSSDTTLQGLHGDPASVAVSPLNIRNNISKCVESSDSDAPSPKKGIFIPRVPKNVDFARTADQPRVSSDEAEEEEVALFKFIKSEWGSITKNMKARLLENMQQIDPIDGEISELKNAVDRFDDDPNYRKFVVEKIEYYKGQVRDGDSRRNTYNNRLANMLYDVKYEKFGYFDWSRENSLKGVIQTTASTYDPWEKIVASNWAKNESKIVGWENQDTKEFVEGPIHPDKR